MDFQSTETLAIPGLPMSVSELPSRVHSELEIRIGVSSCLLGHPVRYDGAHKHDRNVTDVLGRIFNLIAVCPEVESGMPVPREALGLLRGDDGRIRLVGRQSGSDRTGVLKRFSDKRVKEIEQLYLSGYIFKKGSPSCGIRDVPVYTERTDEGVISTPGAVPGSTLQAASGSAAGRGLFADVLISLMPSLPVEEEDRLNDPLLRDTFITRVRAYHHAHYRAYQRKTLNKHA